MTESHSARPPLWWMAVMDLHCLVYPLSSPSDPKSTPHHLTLLVSSLYRLFPPNVIFLPIMLLISCLHQQCCDEIRLHEGRCLTAFEPAAADVSGQLCSRCMIAELWESKQGKPLKLGFAQSLWIFKIQNESILLRRLIFVLGLKSSKQKLILTLRSCSGTSHFSLGLSQPFFVNTATGPMNASSVGQLFTLDLWGFIKERAPSHVFFFSLILITLISF